MFGSLCATNPHFLLSVVAKRKANPIAKKDLLTLMLNGRDPKTGEGMSDRNISHNVRPIFAAVSLGC